MIITNSRGDSIDFGHHFKLIDDFELSGLDADVNYTKSTSDGSNYQNTKLSNRDFNVEFFIERQMKDSWWIEEQRKLAYKVFNPKTNPFRIDIVTKGGEEYYLDANLESVPSFPKGFDNDNLLWLKGLLQFSANDPYFYEKAATKVDIAAWIGAFEFPLEIPEEGIEMGYRSESLIQNVLNSGQMTTGMIIRFTSTSSVSNPSLTNVNTYEVLKLNISMEGGDVIEVSTYTGKKTVTLIQNNVKYNIFNSVDLNSTFLQLEPGDNLFRYAADVGLDSLEVSMLFTNRFMGV